MARRGNGRDKDSPDSPDKDKNNKSKVGGALAGLGGVVGPILGIVGFTLLPDVIRDWLGDNLFPFLPEEYRDTAVAICSSMCCLCSCCLVALVAYMMLKK